MKKRNLYKIIFLLLFTMPLYAYNKNYNKYPEVQSLINELVKEEGFKKSELI